MAERFEGHFKGYDGSKIFFQGWQTELAPKGTIILSHGISEHSECYSNFGKVLTENDWDVIALDHRGHGRSEGHRGYVKNFDEFLKDLKIFIDLVKKNHRRGDKFILFGHSMGGLIATKSAIANGTNDFDALTLSSPAFGLSAEVPSYKEKAAEFANKWLPMLTLKNDIDYDNLSRDPEFLKKYPIDPLRHDKISPRLYYGMLDGFEHISLFASEISLPLLIQMTDNDKIVSSTATRSLFSKFGSSHKVLIEYKDNRHEIFNDIDRDKVYGDYLKFINEL